MGTSKSISKCTNADQQAAKNQTNCLQCDLSIQTGSGILSNKQDHSFVSKFTLKLDPQQPPTLHPSLTTLDKAQFATETPTASTNSE